MAKLLPCPFCGGEATIIRVDLFFPKCTECGCSRYNVKQHRVMFETEAEAIKAWNTRHERITKATYDHRGLWNCCSCGHNRLTDIEPNYCPNCGARVVGDE